MLFVKTESQNNPSNIKPKFFDYLMNTLLLKKKTVGWVEKKQGKVIMAKCLEQ
jgi:hypothetical protein